MSATRKVVTTPVGRVLFVYSSGWWAVELPSFPGAYSQGRTQAEAYLNLLDAISELVKASAREMGVSVLGRRATV